MNKGLVHNFDDPLEIHLSETLMDTIWLQLWDVFLIWPLGKGEDTRTPKSHAFIICKDIST